MTQPESTSPTNPTNPSPAADGGPGSHPALPHLERYLGTARWFGGKGRELLQRGPHAERPRTAASEAR